jgi:hypothetical protein
MPFQILVRVVIIIFFIINLNVFSNIVIIVQVKFLKTDRNHITEILLKVALNTITTAQGF